MRSASVLRGSPGKPISIIVVLLMTMGFVSGAAAPAFSDDGDVNVASITSVDFVNEAVSDGGKEGIRVEWEADASDGRPVEVRVDLPPELQGNAETFTITGEDAEPAGTCTVSVTSVVCALDSSYLEFQRGHLSGVFTFFANLFLDITEVETRVFEFGDVTSPQITIHPIPGPCTIDCDFDGQEGSKSGRYFSDREQISWDVYLPAGADGMLPLEANVTVTEQMDLSVFEIAEGPFVYRAGSVYRSPSGGSKEVPVYGAALPSDQYTVSPDGRTVSFTAAAGHGSNPSLLEGERGLTGSVYIVVWTVNVLDSGTAGEYTNSVQWEINGVTSEEVTSTVARAGGSVVRESLGRFAITKNIDDMSNVPIGQQFTLNWTQYDLDAPEVPGVTGSTQLRVGEPFFSAEIRPNTRVVIEEVLPSDPGGFAWEAPRFIETDAAGVPILGAVPSETLTIDFTEFPHERLGYVSYFSLINSLVQVPAEFGSFSIAKRVEGSAASLVPEGTEFGVDYEWPAGSDFEAGKGTVLVPVGGESVLIEGIPAGARVSLSEDSLPLINGATWEAPVFDPGSFEVDAGTHVEPSTVVRNATRNHSLTRQ